jgi:hypothetical protein
LAVRPGRRRPLERLEYRRWVKNINAGVKEIECEGVHGKYAAQWPTIKKR